MGTQSNVELVKQAYAAFESGDLQKLLGLMSPDATGSVSASASVAGRLFNTKPCSAYAKIHRL